jgi:hypothetical protein
MPHKRSVTTSINSELNKVTDRGIACDSYRDNKNYLDVVGLVPVVKEWTSLYHQEDKRMDLSVEHPFTISFDIKYPGCADLEDDMDNAKVFMGIKDPQKEFKENIEMGIYMGRIYMSHLFDAVNIPKDILVEGVKLLLAVIPLQSNKKCASTLTVLDSKGNEISSIKTSRFLKTDWKGEISTGIHFKSIRMEGIQS